MPNMIIVAGPPGSGKSTLFPVSAFGCDFFNADDHAAALNKGSYHGIPLHIRAEVNRTLEAWIANHIEQRRSFAIETTLRTTIALLQAIQAASLGFTIEMIFIAVDTLDRSLKRVTARAHAGGHSASAAKLEEIRRGSFETLPAAIALCGSVIDVLDVYDNSRFNEEPLHVVTLKKSSHSAVCTRHAKLPAYLEPYFEGL